MSSSIPASSGIYRITCTVTGKFYIGSAADLRRRWLHHRNDFLRHDHHNLLLQRAWNKYGEQSFTFEVIELVLPPFLLEREQYWIDTLKPFSPKGFNIAPIAGSHLGAKRSPESRARISASKIGKPKRGTKHSPETRKKIGESQHGKIIPPEQREKLRIAQLGRKQDPEVARKRGEARKGIPRKPETIEKMRIAMSGREISPEHRAKLSASKLGKELSEDHKRKISETQKGTRHSPESIEKTRLAHLGSKRSPETCARISASKMKHALIVTSPDGTEYVIRSGLSQFCREHNINRSNLTNVAKGHASHTKGWKARFETID